MTSVDKLEEMNLSQDEIKRFTEAMQKPEFKELFFEYAKEISDPDNRRRYESEIRQMENERGMDVKFINPDPGYVIKTAINGDRKAFINVCKNQHIGKPSSAKQVDKNGRSGLSWSLPHSFSPPRDDVAKTGVKCTVYDFVIHPDTYRMAETNPRFKQMINDTALDGIKKMFGVDVDTKNLKFPKLKYKGTPTPTVIRTRLEESTSDTSKGLNKDDLTSSFPYPYDNKTSEEKATDLIASNEKVLAAKAEKNITRKEKQPEDEFTIPKYTVKYQSDLDIQNFTNTPGIRDTTRPKNLIIEVDLPLLQSASPISLDVFEKRLVLTSHKPAKYKLDISLAYPVDENEGSAKFDKSKNKLIVTLPVLQNSNIPKLPFEGEACEKVQQRDETDNIMSNEEIDESAGQAARSKPLIEVISEKESDDVHEVVDVVKNSKEMAPDTADAHSTCTKYSHLMYVLPEFNCREDEMSLFFVFGAKKIQKESVTSTVLSHDSILVQMTSISDGGFPVQYICSMKFRDGCFVDANNCKLSFNDKGSVTLLVIKGKDSLGLWKSFLVGTDMSCLEEQEIEVLTFVNYHGPSVTENSSSKPSLSSDDESLPELDKAEKPKIPVNKQNLISQEVEVKEVDEQGNPELLGILNTALESNNSSVLPWQSNSGADQELEDSSDDFCESSLGLTKSVSFGNHVDQTFDQQLKNSCGLPSADGYDKHPQNVNCTDHDGGDATLVTDTAEKTDVQRVNSASDLLEENDLRNVSSEEAKITSVPGVYNERLDNSEIPQLETSADSGVSDKICLEDFKPAAIPLICNSPDSKMLSVNSERKKNLVAELKNKFVFDLDAD